MCVCVCGVIMDSVFSLATRVYAGRSIVRIPAVTMCVSFFPNIFTCCGALFSGCRGSSPGVKRLDRDTDHSTVSSAEVKNEQRYTSAPLIGLCVHELTGITLPFYLVINIQNSAYLYFRNKRVVRN